MIKGLYISNLYFFDFYRKKYLTLQSCFVNLMLRRKDMRNLKYFVLAFALMFSIGICNVNAAVGQAPGSITTKEDLIYYIYYYGGSAKIVDDKVMLTSSLDLGVALNFTSTEAITIDLNGNHLYFDSNVESTAILRMLQLLILVVLIMIILVLNLHLFLITLVIVH